MTHHQLGSVQIEPLVPGPIVAEGHEKGASKMVTEACVLIRSAPEADCSRTAAWIRDLEAIPEVRRLQRVLGEYDLLATVEAPASPLLAAEKILANRCVERVAVRWGAVAPRRYGVPQGSMSLATPGRR